MMTVPAGRSAGGATGKELRSSVLSMHGGNYYSQERIFSDTALYLSGKRKPRVA
jgi:hypothetical protein